MKSLHLCEVPVDILSFSLHVGLDPNAEPSELDPMNKLTMCLTLRISLVSLWSTQLCINLKISTCLSALLGYGHSTQYTVGFNMLYYI